MYCTTPYARLTRVVGVNYALFGACSNTLAVDKLHACVYSNSSFIIHCERCASRLHTKLGIALSFRKSFYLIVLIAWSDQGIDCIYLIHLYYQVKLYQQDEKTTIKSCLNMSSWYSRSCWMLKINPKGQFFNLHKIFNSSYWNMISNFHVGFKEIDIAQRCLFLGSQLWNDSPASC